MSVSHPLRGIQAVFFDAYGTLFDVKSLAEVASLAELPELLAAER